MQTNNARTRYLARGTLTVTARGYWFTAGGEKGPFGYYPHLKDENGYPVYPDTQMHGDLKMAAGWLRDLVAMSGSEQSEQAEQIKRFEQVFGKTGNPRSALLRVNDLELTDQTKQDQNNRLRDPGDFFEIKPRIQIQDETGTVKEKMLVDREVAWLDGCELAAVIYLGYFNTAADLDAAKEMVKEAAGFLSGFGGFRSRGYGRGTVSVKWDEDFLEETNIDLDDSGEAAGDTTVPYFLTALTHFRNKPVEPGATQVLGARRFIAAEQLRGWFVRAWHDIYAHWPASGDLAGITFPALYPSDAERDLQGHPTPVTTLKNEADEIRDIRGMDPDQMEPEDQAEGEDFFRTKSKPLSEDWFISEQNGKPQVIRPVRSEYRMRNAMDEEGKFTTIDDGLFVQELVRRGTCFGGRFRLAEPESGFGQKALRILQHLKPEISGTLFEPVIKESRQDAGAAAQKDSFLVAAPICFSSDRFQMDAKDQINLGVVRRYNTMLTRPRRNRIVIEPGSVLAASEEGKTVTWSGFGEKKIPVAVAGKKPAKKDEKAAPEPDASRFKPKINEITRAQAGLLRDYLHPRLRKADIERNLIHRIEKYSGKEENKLLPLLKDIQSKLDQEGVEEMRRFIRTYLEDLAVCWWHVKSKKKGGES